VRPVAVVLLALLPTLTPAPAAADYRQSYLDGRRALERGDLEQAIALLGAAARERPVEQARARLVGAIPEPYLPHHLLGLAHFRARRCPQALAEWALSEEQGAVASVAAAAAVARRHRGDCERLAAAAAAVERAAAAAAGLGTGAGGELGGRERSPGLEDRRRAALAALESARARLAAGRREWDFAAIGEALEQADAAAAALVALRDELRRRPEPEAAGEPPAPSAPAALDATPSAPDPTGAAAPAPAALGGPEPGPEPPPSAAAAASPASPALPAPLLGAIQAYFDGDYGRALALLEAGPAAFESGRARFLAALFRGASRHALYLLGGERDAALRRAAEADLAECRRAEPGFVPHADHFSPRFVAFFARLPAAPRPPS
jgi:hypothetical protein